jgi:T4-like virus tail tube protein gp19
MVDSIFKNDYRPWKAGQSLPKVSTLIDSIRTYQFEVQFYGLPPYLTGQQTDLTLAAKQVSPISFSVGDIEVRRMNDKVYYPGQPSQESVSITFDNLYLRKTCATLWEWFKTIYDPIGGDMTKLSAPGGPGNKTFKANKLRILELDNTRTPHAAIELYGVYPKSVKFSEKNYNSNDFATIEVEFRYDFMDYFNYG